MKFKAVGVRNFADFRIVLEASEDSQVQVYMERVSPLHWVHCGYLGNHQHIQRLQHLAS